MRPHKGLCRRLWLWFCSSTEAPSLPCGVGVAGHIAGGPGPAPWGLSPLLASPPTPCSWVEFFDAYFGGLVEDSFQSIFKTFVWLVGFWLSSGVVILEWQNRALYWECEPVRGLQAASRAGPGTQCGLFSLVWSLFSLQGRFLGLFQSLLLSKQHQDSPSFPFVFRGSALWESVFRCYHTTNCFSVNSGLTSWGAHFGVPLRF